MHPLRFSNLLLSLLCVLGAQALAGSGSPRTFLMDSAVLIKARGAYREGDRRIIPAVHRLLKDAEKALALKPLSVMDKEQVPPSGNKHDYMSLGRYWWPDPSKPNGLPYIRRDGQSNPEADNISDHKELSQVADGVATLALGYFFSGDEKFAEHATLLIRTWFLESGTRMNPHLLYAQSVRGRNEGRGAGIIDARQLPELIDGVGLLGGSRSWTARDQQELKAWFADYLKWLQGSDHGKRETAAKNNHGTWYDVQVSAAAMFVGDTAAAAATLRNAKTKRIAAQIEPDGSQPAELARTKSWDYSLFNLTALFRLAALGGRVGVDLWNFETPDGRSIQKAVDWFLPYAVGDQEWNHEQIVERKTAGLAELFLQAAAVWGNEQYGTVVEKVHGFNATTDRSILFLGVWEQNAVSAPSRPLHPSKGKP